MFLGLIKWRTCWNICWIDGNVPSLHHKALTASKDRAAASQPRWSICVPAPQTMTVCQIPYPLGSPGKDRQSITNPPSLLCSSCRKFCSIPLFSTWFKNFSFGVNAAYCPTCFFEGIQSSVFLQSVWVTRKPGGLHLLQLSFFNTWEELPFSAAVVFSESFSRPGYVIPEMRWE